MLSVSGAAFWGNAMSIKLIAVRHPPVKNGVKPVASSLGRAAALWLYVACRRPYLSSAWWWRLSAKAGSLPWRRRASAGSKQKDAVRAVSVYGVALTSWQVGNLCCCARWSAASFLTSKQRRAASACHRRLRLVASYVTEYRGI